METETQKRLEVQLALEKDYPEKSEYWKAMILDRTMVEWKRSRPVKSKETQSRNMRSKRLTGKG